MKKMLLKFFQIQMLTDVIHAKKHAFSADTLAQERNKSYAMDIPKKIYEQQKSSQQMEVTR